MKASQLAVFLAAAITHRLPVLITGAPGVGKSDVVKQAAVAAKANLLLSHPAVEDPTDPKGLPWPDATKGTASFLPFGNFALAIKAKKLTVWCLEDLGQAQPAVQAGYMQLLLAREVNGKKLPDCVTFVACTNRRVDRAGVAGILEPVKSRFVAIVELTADLDDWCVWLFERSGLVDDIAAPLAAFLRFKPDLLCQFAPSADMTNSPVPRTWAHAGKLLTLNLPKVLESEALGGAVGTAAAQELQAFLQMYRELPSVDAILLDPDAQPLPTELNVLYAVVTALAMKANEQNFTRVARYGERLLEAAHGEFAALLLRDATRRDAKLQSTPAFVRLMAGELGQMVTGSIN